MAYIGFRLDMLFKPILSHSRIKPRARGYRVGGCGSRFQPFCKSDIGTVTQIEYSAVLKYSAIHRRSAVKSNRGLFKHISIS
jgi:hypothetical protein